LAKALRDNIWESKLRPLEQHIMQESLAHADALLKRAATNTMPESYFHVDLNPSGPVD
jgi:hypothetical protein